MTATYRLNVNELSLELINSIRDAFKDKTIEITVSEASDETDYLLTPLANKQHLEKSLEEINEGKGIVFTVEEFQKKYGQQ